MSGKSSLVWAILPVSSQCQSVECVQATGLCLLPGLSACLCLPFFANKGSYLDGGNFF